MESLVSVFTEWGALEEVIVGDCLSFNIDLLDPTFEFVYYESLKSQKYRKTEQYKIDRKRLEQRTKDLNNLASTLESLGVIVRRPNPLEKAIGFRTPWFKGICMAPDSPRDTVACIGNSIIETPTVVRGRYFENTHYKDIFMEYFKNGARWISAPRATLAEGSIEWESTWKDKEPQTFHEMHEIEPQYEIAFDAANFLKIGKDILFNVGCKNHELGARWLQQTLGPEFNVILTRMCDSHIDGAIALLAPGKILYNPTLNAKRNIRDQLPEKMKNWDMIPTEEENLDFCWDDKEIMLASQKGMFMNVLSINETTVMVQDTAINTIKSLEKHGFDVIPIEFNQGRLFSGGLHCCTVDVRRDDTGDTFI